MLKIYEDLQQGSDEWKQARLGILTASQMKLAMTPTFKAADNEKSRAHMFELAAQRITGHIEDEYISDDMIRGMVDEIDARYIYDEKIAPVKEVGFITNDKFGFTIGYSPDGLVGNDGLIEIKSRRQKSQIETILSDQVPVDYMLQLQTGLLVSERKWIDFISYSAGLPMFVKRVLADVNMQAKILEAASYFEQRVKDMCDKYQDALSSDMILIPTERRKAIMEEQND